MENWGGGGGQLTKTVQHAFAGKPHVIFLSWTSARNIESNTGESTR
jgi:hypothetical protein